MKKIEWLQLFIVVIGIILCIIGHNGAKKYVFNLQLDKKTNTVVYNNYSDVSFNYSSITTEQRGSVTSPIPNFIISIFGFFEEKSLTFLAIVEKR